MVKNQREETAMRDLRADLTNLWRSAARLTPLSGGRAIMFLAARGGEGTTSMAASFALIAAERCSRSVWLVDLDLRRDVAYRGFEAGFAGKLGRPGRPFDASLNETPFFSVEPEAVGSGAKLLTVHQIGNSRLMVTRFRHENVLPAQKIRIHTQPRWWAALRRSTDWIIVDAPALDRSSAGLAVANQMDGVVLVMASDETTASEAQSLKLEVEAHGGKILGVVFNRIRPDARLADRISG